MYSAAVSLRLLWAEGAASAAVVASAKWRNAAMNGDKAAVRTLVQQKANVNAPQVDGTTALHWAVQANDIETAGSVDPRGRKKKRKVSAANQAGAATPLMLATINGNAAMIGKLIAGADPQRKALTKSGDTAAHDDGANREDRRCQGAPRSWGAGQREGDVGRYDTPLMWAVSRAPPGRRSSS